MHRIIFPYYLILVLALITNYFTLKIRKLPVGRAWEALREDEIACKSLGVNPTNTKLTAFAIGAMFGGFAGSFFATRQAFISPESFTFIESAIIVAIVVLGGMGSQTGVVLASIFLIGITEIFRDLEQYRMIAFGGAMVLIMVFKPKGILANRKPTILMHGDKMNNLLSVENLTMKFGGLVAIDNLSFNAQNNQITSIIGPNGAGKTTVFNCLTGFYKPTTGQMYLHKDENKVSLRKYTDFKIAHVAKVARTFQNIRLFPAMSVLENLLVAQHNELMVASGYSLYGLLNLKSYREKEKHAVDKSKYWLDIIGLTHRADDNAGDLPYGDQRKLEIVRAMCIEPKLLCLDEPAAGLNPKESAELNKLLKFIKNEKTGILLIEHDMSVVMGISDHVVVLNYGKKIFEGTAEQTKKSKEVIEAYLGVDD